MGMGRGRLRNLCRPEIGFGFDDLHLLRRQAARAYSLIRLYVPRISSAALTSWVALPASRL